MQNFSSLYQSMYKESAENYMYFQYSKFKKGYNSKKIRKLTILELDRMFIRRKGHKKFQTNTSCTTKVRKTVTDGRRPGRTDGYHHTTVRPI